MKTFYLYFRRENKKRDENYTMAIKKNTLTINPGVINAQRQTPIDVNL